MGIKTYWNNKKIQKKVITISDLRAFSRKS